MRCVDGFQVSIASEKLRAVSILCWFKALRSIAGEQKLHMVAVWTDPFEGIWHPLKVRRRR